MEQQITNHVIMVRPAAFGYNPETAINNTFQHPDGDAHLASMARAEFDNLVETLRKEGVHVTVFEDTADPVKPDAVFPNNWISFHADGSVVTYPMFSPARRLERSDNIISALAEQHTITQRLMYEHHEAVGRFLEGTGSLVLDRVHRIAYACLSPRTDSMVLNEWCGVMGYTPFSMHASFQGQPIYHTNVMMAVGNGIAVVGLDVVDANEQEALLHSLQIRGREVVQLSASQIGNFAGNMLAVHNDKGEQLMVMSSTARASLSDVQVAAIGKHARIVAVEVPTIERVGGGSVRCMLAENFLPPI